MKQKRKTKKIRRNKRESKLDKIRNFLNKKNKLCYIHKNLVEAFERTSDKEGKSIMPIMTYGDYTIYLQADSLNLPIIPLSKFNFTSGTFEKKWGPDHKTIILTPNHSSIRKVEIEIQGMDINNMKLLSDKSGDVIEDVARIKITRHYRFSEGNLENKGDSIVASPGQIEAK